MLFYMDPGNITIMAICLSGLKHADSCPILPAVAIR